MSCPGGPFLLFKDLVSEESLLGRIAKYLTILKNGLDGDWSPCRRGQAWDVV